MTASKEHPILAIAYALSRWGETSPGDIYEACRLQGIERGKAERAIDKLIELRNIEVRHGNFVWIGKPYACDPAAN